MPEGTRMLPGFNHDIPRQGKAYHVQTEDLGAANPHVVTHVFLGGSVIAVKRTSYAALLQGADPTRAVRELMKEQHKEMVRGILAGAYDPPAAAPASVGAARPPPGGGAVRSPPGASAPSPAAARVVPRPAPSAPAATNDEEDQNLDRVILAYLAGEPVDRKR